jgi:ribosome-associated protein
VSGKAPREVLKLEAKDYAILAAEAAADKKATDIVVLEVSELLVITDYFVLCTGNTDRQVKVIAEEVEKVLKAAGLTLVGAEGEREGIWVLLDFGDVVVHVFQPQEREFYRLEKLWGTAPRVELPESVTGPGEAEPASSPADAR